MPTRDICCMHCSLKGGIEVFDLNGDIPPSKIFKRLGNNPFSGHMHYQCPACGIVLLVNPLDVLGDVAVKGVPEASFSQNKPLMQWIFRAERMMH
jgi:hypothetical protein